ncbi:hypothetical protein [Vibrio sp. TRT 17S01]|nr:hypothetical protein [Vibrio parahaemolyticus]ELA9329853.1 hypothetical protein [Vibrio parahaemolyticus]
MTQDRNGQQRRPPSKPHQPSPATGSADGASRMKPVIGGRKKPGKK